MQALLVGSILVIGLVFVSMTVLIVVNKGWRDGRVRRHEIRRRVLAPRVLRYMHGRESTIESALGAPLSAGDRPVVEKIFIDLFSEADARERAYLSTAFDELGYIDAYLHALNSHTWFRRAEAAEKLGIAGVQRTVAGLTRAMGDEVADVRLRAAQALGRMGGAMAIRPLVQALSEPSRWSTIRIADILTRMGRQVLDQLIEVFPAMNLAAKVAALDILANLGDARVAPWLRERLGDHDPDVRSRALNALGALGDMDSGEEMLRCLEDDEWPVRAMAAKALGRVLHLPAIPDLCHALRDREWWVRANAAEALRLMGPEGLEALEQMLDDRDPYARHQAVVMLQEAGVLDDQVRGLVDEEPERRNAARTFVQRLIKAGQLGSLREIALHHPDPALRERLRALLPSGTLGQEAVA